MENSWILMTGMSSMLQHLPSTTILSELSLTEGLAVNGFICRSTLRASHLKKECWILSAHYDVISTYSVQDENIGNVEPQRLLHLEDVALEGWALVGRCLPPEDGALSLE